ncbi:MAG: ABC transporter substrate-binding protein [Vampirovibrionales bacterium]
MFPLLRIVLVLMLIGILPLFGTQKGGACQHHVYPSNPPPIELQFWTLQLADFKTALLPAIHAFEARHSNVRVHWVDLPINEGEKRLLTAMLSPAVPDVVNLNLSFAATLAQRQTLHNLSTLTTPQQRGSFLPIALTPCQYHRQLFALPWYLTTKVIYVNQAHLQGLGVSAERLLQPDWQPSTQQAQWLKQHRVYITQPSLAENGSFITTLQQQGVQVQWDETHQRLNLQPKALLESRLGRLRQQLQQGWIPRESLVAGHRQAMEAYLSGRLLYLEAGSSLWNLLETNAPHVAEHTRILPATVEVNRPLALNPMVLAVPKRSQHPQLATELLLTVLATQHQLALAKQAPVLPSTREGLARIAQASQTCTKAKAGACRVTTVASQQLLQAKASLPFHPQQKLMNEASDTLVQQALLKEVP